MWNILQQSPAYYIKFNKEKDEYVVSVTNYLNIWVIRLTKTSFLQVLKDSDEDTVFDDEDDLLKKGISMLSHPEQLKTVTISEKEGTLNVSMTKLYGFLMFLNLNLTLGSNVCMFKEVIQPLLLTVKDLRESQTELRQELKKKDKEIEEYKCEGGEIALRHLKTVLFDDEKHLKNHPHYEENFSAELIEQSLKHLKELSQPTLNGKSPNQTPITEPKKEGPVPNITQSSQEKSKQEAVTIKTEPLSEEHRVENPVDKLEHHIKIETSEETTIKCEPSSQSIENKRLIAIPPRKRQRSRLNF